jgi:hypothetical protein
MQERRQKREERIGRKEKREEMRVRRVFERYRQNPLESVKVQRTATNLTDAIDVRLVQDVQWALFRMWHLHAKQIPQHAAVKKR